MGTHQPKASDIVREWHVIDAKDLVLGHVATQAAHLLRGKHKPTWVPHMDVGDNVIVINAEKIDVSAKKAADKNYYFHSGFPGGLRNLTLAEMIERKPEKVIELAVKGMLPHGRLGRAMSKKLHVYAGEEHPHAAQQPKAYEIKSKKEKTNA
ncbi:MAG: 50S ribosomal protein L13 [Acidimicrobiia bacterium]